MTSIVHYNYDKSRKYKFKFVLDYNSMFRWYRYYEKLTPKIIGNLLSMNWKCCNTDFLNHIFDNGYISQEELLTYKLS